MACISASSRELNDFFVYDIIKTGFMNLLWLTALCKHSSFEQREKKEEATSFNSVVKNISLNLNENLLIIMFFVIKAPTGFTLCFSYVNVS